MNEKTFPPALFGAPALSRIRRNHALEHATLHVLNERHRNLRLVGRSSLWGFSVYGAVPTESLVAAAQDALKRLRNGERHLAVHPNCGSNLAVAGTLAGLAAFLALGGGSRGRFSRLARLPLACAAATVSIILAPPLGLAFQAHVTTQSDIGSLLISTVSRQRWANVLVHRVRTEG